MSEPRRVLLVSHSSVVDVYQDKLRHLARQPGIELTLLLPERYREGNRVVEAYKGDGTYRVITRPAPFAERGRQNGFWFRGLRSVFRTVRPDILHLEEEPESLVSVQLVRHALRMKRPPSIVGFTWRNWPMPYPHWPLWHPKRILFSLLQGITIPHLDAIIAGTHDAEPEYRKLGYEGPVSLIPQYGVDPGLYRPLPDRRDAVRERLGLHGNSLVVGFVGRVMRMKGLDVLVDALTMTKDRDITVAILGDGDYADAVRERARNNGVADNIRFLAGVPAREVPDILNAFDVLTIPSLSAPHWREQFGRVIIEAMACRVPVIGSDSGEIPWVIGDAGIVTPEGDAQALANAIVRMHDDPDERRRLALAGERRVHRHYTNERLAEAIAGVYETLPTRKR